LKKIGFDGPLYIMPFDHRHPYASEVFGFADSMGPEQVAQAVARKRVVYDAFCQALADGVQPERAGILVDERFGADILRDARQQGRLTIVPTEKSGHHEFDFDYGEQFAEHITAFAPTFAKVLVQYNPQGKSARNQQQIARLKRISDYCRQQGLYFMFELIVPPEAEQLSRVAGDRQAYDVELRPALMAKAMCEIQDLGIEPDVWKIEGLDRSEDGLRVAAAARRNGRDQVGCVILGRGEDQQKVRHWLETAARVPGFSGFAVGRSTFSQPLVALNEGQMTREATVAEIARRFKHWVDVFEQAQAA
jgi:myo-inositol catabolism protein IolC